MYLNILCLVCINLHYTSNCAEFDRNAWIFSQFSTQSCSEINSNDNLLTEFIQTKVIMAPFTLITLINLFGRWLITQFNVFWFSWVQQSISTHYSRSMSEIFWRYTSVAMLSTLNNPQDLDPEYFEDSFPVQWTLKEWQQYLHRSRYAAAYLRYHVPVLPEFIEPQNWPPDSPDLNPLLILNFVRTNSVCSWSFLLLSLYVRVKIG